MTAHRLGSHAVWFARLAVAGVALALVWSVSHKAAAVLTWLAVAGVFVAMGRRERRAGKRADAAMSTLLVVWAVTLGAQDVWPHNLALGGVMVLLGLAWVTLVGAAVVRAALRWYRRRWGTTTITVPLGVGLTLANGAKADRLTTGDGRRYVIVRQLNDTTLLVRPLPPPRRTH